MVCVTQIPCCERRASISLINRRAKKEKIFFVKKKETHMSMSSSNKQDFKKTFLKTPSSFSFQHSLEKNKGRWGILKISVELSRVRKWEKISSPIVLVPSFRKRQGDTRRDFFSRKKNREKCRGLRYPHTLHPPDSPHVALNPKDSNFEKKAGSRRKILGKRRHVFLSHFCRSDTEKPCEKKE